MRVGEIEQRAEGKQTYHGRNVRKRIVQLEQTESEPRLRETRIGGHGPDEDTHHSRKKSHCGGLVGNADDYRDTHEREKEYLRRAEAESNLGNGIDDQYGDYRRNGPAEGRGRERNTQCVVGLSFHGQRVAVQRGGAGACRTRCTQQDGRYRPAVLAPDIYRPDKDKSALGGHTKSRRQEDRGGIAGTETGNAARHKADHQPEQQQSEGLEGKKSLHSAPNQI